MAGRRSFLGHLLAAPVALLTNGLGRGVRATALSASSPMIVRDSLSPGGTLDLHLGDFPGMTGILPCSGVSCSCDFLSDPNDDDWEEDDDVPPPAPIPPFGTFVHSTSDLFDGDF